MKKIIIFAITVCLLLVGCTGNNSSNAKSESTPQATEAPSTTPATEADPVSGKIVILNNLFEGYLYTAENAADLYKNIDPTAHKNNQKFVDLYNTGERYYDESLNVTFIYYTMEDGLKFHLGSNKCDIYDFSDRDFSSPDKVDLSKKGLEKYKDYTSSYGNFTLYR